MSTTQYTEALPESLSFFTNTERIAGSIKRSPEDFVVTEISSYPPEHPDGDFTIIELELNNWETNRAIKVLTKRLRISRARVGFGGTKDKRAITRQLISIRGHVDPDRINIKDMQVIRHYRSNRSMKMGDLIGNSFIIRVVDVAPGDHRKALNTLDTLNTRGGFPNYFGAQRFGSLRPITHIVGKHITLGDFESAVKTYIGMPFTGEPDILKEARTLAENDDTLAEALNTFPTDYTFERSMIHYLLSNPGEYVGALEQLPKNLTLMFVHAYQGHLFNKILDRRISEGYPLTPLVGDRILPMDKAGLPEHGDGIPVTEMNLKKMLKKAADGKAFVSGLVIGTEAEFAQGVQGEIEEKVIVEEFGSIDRKRFIIPEIPRLTTKGIRRELLAPLKNASIREEEDTLVFKFDLNKGCYATALLREFFKD